MSEPVDVSVIIPTWRRPRRLLESLARVQACDPPPREVLVHVDAGDDETAPALAAAPAGPAPVRVLRAETRVGPGGGRNRLMREAACECLFSLDDDSYPCHPDCFGRAVALLERYPHYALFALPAPLPGVEPPDAGGQPRETIMFEGCGAVLRRSAVLGVAGYLPLRHAFGMEESDLSLQLLDAGHRLARVDRPCVRHEIDISGHARPEVNAAKIVNTALLPMLRYPWPYVLLMPVRVLRRVRYSMALGRFRGIGCGLAGIPAVLWRYRRLRKPVKRATMRAYLKLRG